MKFCFRLDRSFFAGGEAEPLNAEPLNLEPRARERLLLIFTPRQKCIQQKGRNTAGGDR